MLLAMGVVLVLAAVGIVVAVTAGGGSDGDRDDSTAAPSSVTGTAGGASATSTLTLEPADADLVAALLPFTVTDCRSAPRDGDGVVVAVSCAPGSSTAASAPEQLSVISYGTAEALQADLRERSVGLAGSDPGTTCAHGRSGVERWARTAHRRGSFVCRVTPGRFAVYWTVDDSRLGFTAELPDADQFFAWWRAYDPI
nr:hypothetical protein [Candidatus Frankia nodulisporulans]